MKKQIKTIVLASCVFLSSFVFQQASAQFSAGVRAGINFSTEQFNNIYHESLVRPYGGIFANYKTASPFALQAELNLSGEGANFKDLSSGDTYQIRHSYLNIPILAQYRFGFGGYIELGPQFGFLLSAKEKYNGESSVDVKNYYKSTDFGAALGFGYEFNHKSMTGLGINVRYIRGLSTIVKDAVDGNEVKTRVLSVGLTYRFSAGKPSKK